MNKLILILFLFLPLLALAEYSGVQVKFEVTFNDGSTSIGYKYVAHGENSEEQKGLLEQNPGKFLFNEFTFEPGEYGYYTTRLEYQYEEQLLYELINPVEVKLEDIKQLEVLELIIAPYDVQIEGRFSIYDQEWMNSEAIVRYSSFEDMCVYDTFIHSSKPVSEEVQAELFQIIESYEKKINEAEQGRDYGEEALIEEILKIHLQRFTEIETILLEHPELKQITVSLCTC